MKSILLFFIFSVSLAQISAHGHTHDHHGHAHGEDVESPSFRYSKEANEAVKQWDEQVKQKEKEDKKEPTIDPIPAKITNVRDVWLSAIASTLLISIAPFLILFFIRLDNTEACRPYLKVLLAFASGGLLGDAFLHLIPHSLSAHLAEPQAHSHSHSHSHGHGHSHNDGLTSLGFWVLSGIFVFFLVEKIVRIIKGGHSHSHGDDKSKGKAKDKDASKDKDKSRAKGETPEEDIQVAGYLNLVADFVHNLTDGLSIGASYLAGNSIGIVTTITVLFHEVPHEIGDFAILIKSGMSRKKALWLQLVTALGALTGTILSLSAVEMDEAANSWILPFTSGGFIYVATVSVIPELLESSSFWQSLYEIAAFALGVAIMSVLANYE